MKVKIIECPRDAMQGMHNFVPTKRKVEYINKLLEVGFHTLDCGSFVSPKAIPQMKDTAEVLDQLNDSSSTKLSVIVANVRGANDAKKISKIDYLGFPFSVSETFQKRNTNSSMAESLDSVKQIHEICQLSGKEMVVYISMGFGNPYNDEWNSDLVNEWVGKIHEIGVRSFSISDTVGVSEKESIIDVFTSLSSSYQTAEFGAHFHTTPNAWHEKIDAAWASGCKRFDGALKGFGGCPMAKDDLVGNMPTENLLAFFSDKNIETGLNNVAFLEALKLADSVFN